VGTLVQGLSVGEPAEKAGVEVGDIILKVDGKAVERSGDLPRMIGATKPGTRVILNIWRKGAARDLAITVAEFEPDRTVKTASKPEPKASAPLAKNALGLAAVELTDAQRKELKLKGGVRVEAVEGAAARAGIREGDVILSVDNTDVIDMKLFNAAVAKADKSKPMALLVRRGDVATIIVIRPAR
jgi:serine protease Do